MHHTLQCIRVFPAVQYTATMQFDILYCCYGYIRLQCKLHCTWVFPGNASDEFPSVFPVYFQCIYCVFLVYFQCISCVFPVYFQCSIWVFPGDASDLPKHQSTPASICISGNASSYDDPHYGHDDEKLWQSSLGVQLLTNQKQRIDRGPPIGGP